MTLSAATPANRGHQYPAPAFLIYGSAIRNRANSPRFTNMQFSNRQLNEGLNIMSLIFLEKIRRGGPLAPLEEIRPCSPLSTSHLLAQRRNTADEGPLATEILIANARLEFAVSHSKEGLLKISNRERIAISNRIQPPRPRPAYHSSLITRHCLPNPACKLTPPQRTPILILPPKENRHGKPRHTERRPNPYRKIYGRTLAALCD